MFGYHEINYILIKMNFIKKSWLFYIIGQKNCNILDYPCLSITFSNDAHKILF